jgi:hypothetical protein
MLILAHPFINNVKSIAKELYILLEEFQAFAPIFSLEKAAILLAFNKHIYLIDLEGKIVLLAGPIYPLIELELEVLQAYINNVLAIGCI